MMAGDGRNIATTLISIVALCKIALLVGLALTFVLGLLSAL